MGVLGEGEGRLVTTTTHHELGRAEVVVGHRHESRFFNVILYSKAFSSWSSIL